MNDRAFDGVTAAYRDSAVYRTAQALRRQVIAASRESALLARGRGLSSLVAARTPEQAVARIALVFAWAAIAHLAMRSALPRYATSGLPAWWNLAFAAFAFAAAALAPAIVAAWRDSTPARWIARRY